MSFVQQRLWIFDQLEPQLPVFHRPSRLRMRGGLEVPVLTRVLEEIVRRHEALRTIFVQDAEGPHSVLLPAEPLSLPCEDVSHLGAENQETRIQEWEKEDSRPFALSRGPLFRARLVRLGPQDHLLLWNVHHIVFDAWSMSVLLREIEILYEAFSTGESSPLPEPAIQYSDFAEWQRDQLDGPALRLQLEHWRKTLSGAPDLFDLPFDRPRPDRMSYRGAAEDVEIGPDMTAKIKELARREGATLFMATVAAFEALLWSYSGRADFLVGVPTAGRGRSETEGLIGCFINTVVIRADLTGRPTFRQLLTRVRRTALEAFSSQEIPFERVVEELRPTRSLRHAPLFQIMANFRNVPRRTGIPCRLQVEVENKAPQIAMVDLALELEEGEKGLTARFTYSTDLFESSSMRRMAEALRTLIERVAADPDRPIGDLLLARTDEVERAEAAWNETDRPYPGDRCVHDLFEEQVALGPDRIAISLEGARVTYAELDARANFLARQLRREGVGPEAPVGLCFEPSVEMFVALLGVWKAGGAWVALDPAWPRSRLAFAAEDSGCLLVLFGAETEEIASRLELRRLRVEAGAGKVAEESRDPALPGDGGRLAYILYTSGSTGEPKGVAVEHHSVVNYLSWVNESLLAGQRLRIPLVSKLSFDACLKQLLAPLLRGDSVWILPPETVARPDALRRALSTAGPVGLNCVPALWSVLLDDLRKNPLGAPLDDLKAIFLGGEVLSLDLIERTFAALPGIEVWNLYGPTESTANATAARVRPGVEVSIGRPIANAKAYVLNDQGRPVPIGVSGELFVGGDGVARGYWRRKELTKERFLPDPFRKRHRARMYKTGDLVRRKPDGSLEFLGRIDDQVKVRGVRVEPGEVESVLASHHAVREAIVLARDEATTGTRLVAYVVFDPTAHSSVGQLRDHLRQRLPEVMVPSAFIELDKLPRLANGKVDRHSLPEPDETITSGEENRPRTKTEDRLLAIWCELLQQDRIGIEESFFDRGGHSLLAAQAITRIRQVFGLEVPLRTIFESPSVESMAKRVDALAAIIESEKPLLPRALHGQPVPLSYPQERLWFLAQLEPGNPFYNVFKAFRIEGRLDAKAFARALDAIVDRHDSLRTFFPVTDGVPRQEVFRRESTILKTHDITTLPAQEREAEALRIASEEAERPFDLSRGPLIRATLVRLGSEEHVFLLTIHHIVCDGWSLGLFFRELALFYESFRSGKAPDLAPLALRYADFAFWQRQWLNGEVLASRLKYWHQRLEGVPPVLELPTDRRRPPRPTYRGSREYFIVPPELSEALRELGRREGATLFMTLLACFQALLSRYSGSSDVVVGSPIANRSWRETEDLIGFFINTLVLRTDLSTNPTFRQLLRTVRETSLEDYAHQDIPFEKLIEELRPERTTSYPPIFQVLFALQSGPRTDLSLSGLTVTPLRADPGRTKFDLALSFRETKNGLEGTLSFSTDLFDVETVRMMAAHFVTLAASVVQGPDQTVGDLALLSEAERRRLLVEWNQTDAQRPSTSVPDLVRQEGDRWPEAVAVESTTERLSYGEVRGRANQVAGRLREQGFGPDQLAALCVDRSPEMIVGMLGILEAGGAYLPIDPLLPPGRVDFMLEDAKPRWIVAPARIASRFANRGLQIVSPEVSLDSARRSESAPGDDFPLDRLAYVIYTSGSTGRPKGVEVTHRALANFVFWARNAFELGPADRVLQFAPFHFDTSVEEIFPCLASGATLVLRTDAMLENPEAFFGECEKMGITILDLPTAFWHELIPALERGDAALPACLRLVIIGGEAALPERLEQWNRAVGGRVRLLNTYGPTEATVAATMAELTASPSSRSASPWKVPIGRPIDNMRAYVLDSRRHPVPIGVRGELFLGGVGLARGYRNDSTLTARQFTSEDYASPAGARVYRTGDLVRYRRDGALEFLGRVDDQVKIRGFRVEPGEVEKVLITHPSIFEVAVISREDVPGDRRLAAYFSRTEGASEPTGSELRDFLAERLPDYLIPQAFVCLARLPRTLAGKLDRAALPAPMHASSASDSKMQPDNTLERLVASIWCQVFGFERVGRDEDFFELGGHSLMATRVLSRLRARIPLELPLRLLFEHPTVAGMSEAISRIAQERGVERELVGDGRR